MAHVGVLKLLDELQLHVDAIAGTSMGAVVGGLYASGMSAREIETLLSSPEWQDAFRDRPPRQSLNFRRKEEDREFLVDLPLGIQGRQLRIPTGLLQEQKLTQLLRQATLPVAGVTQFDQLKVPFRAVATDLETGTPVVMASGDLATALRASFSAPGVFAPVERDGRLLVDGGLVENLPIDVARTMNVDVLIVVDAGFALQPRGRLNSLASVSNQALAILVRRDVERQRSTLTPRDVLIQPALGDRSSYDFRAVESAIDAGELAALRGAAAAHRAGEPAAPARGSGRPTDSSAAANDALRVVHFIATEPGSERYLALMHRTFGDQIGKPLDPELITHRLNVIYGTGNFEVLDYRLVQSPQGTDGPVIHGAPQLLGPELPAPRALAPG